MVRFRKTVSLLLVLCLMMAMLPAEALAADANSSEAESLAEEGSGVITLDGEDRETQLPTEVESSTDEQETANGETPPPAAPATEPSQSEGEPPLPEDEAFQPEGESPMPEDQPLQPEDQPQPVEDAESGQDSQSGIPEDDLSTPVDTPDMTLPNENDSETVTRIAWIHELALRFSASPEDYGFAEVAFSDYSQSEEYYQDAVWAWNTGLFPENDNLSIDPFAPATYEFSANTLCSCLELGLSAESAAYAVTASAEKSGTDSMQVAKRRGWFDGDTGSFDANLTREEVSAMLRDAEEIVSLAEVLDY